MSNSSIKVGISSIVTAFADATVGTKVIDREAFMSILVDAIAAYDFDGQKVPGQGFLPLPETAVATVSAGVGENTNNLDDYIVRENRGVVGAYLRREKAAKADSVAAVVYTAAAYFADPQVSEEERNRIKDSGATHVLVAVLASAGPKSQVTYKRFVENLAGGNREYAPDATSVEALAALANEVATYHKQWCVVAD